MKTEPTKLAGMCRIPRTGGVAARSRPIPDSPLYGGSGREHAPRLTKGSDPQAETKETWSSFSTACLSIGRRHGQPPWPKAIESPSWFWILGVDRCSASPRGAKESPVGCRRGVRYRLFGWRRGPGGGTEPDPRRPVNEVSESLLAKGGKT